MSDILVQRIDKVYTNKIECSIVYYSVLSALNNLNLTKSEIELLAFTNVRGTISSITAKKEFIKIYNVHMNTIGNMITRLSKRKLLVKTDTKVHVHPSISISFDKDFILNINIVNAELSK